MHFITTDADGDIGAGIARPGGDQMNGNAVMYHAGKIVAFGGCKNYEKVPALKATSIITLSGSQASAKPSTPLNFERSFGNGVVLPDGKVMAIGGMPHPIAFDDTNSVLPTGASHAHRVLAICTCAPLPLQTHRLRLMAI